MAVYKSCIYKAVYKLFPRPPSLRGRIYALASYEALPRHYHYSRKAHTPSVARCLILLRYKAVCVFRLYLMLCDTNVSMIREHQ